MLNDIHILKAVQYALPVFNRNKVLQVEVAFSGIEWIADSLFGDRFCKQPDKIERKVSPLCALVLIIEFIKGDTGEVINQFTYIL